MMLLNVETATWSLIILGMVLAWYVGNAVWRKWFEPILKKFEVKEK